MSKRKALRALKLERWNATALYVEATVPERQAAKGRKAQIARAKAAAQHRRIPVRP